jgi:UDP-N-acetylmuramoyl-tripeptide--D-alanyl-D-alanine ligase
MEISKLYEIWKRHSAIATDSRKIVKGSIFFALRGEHFNGNLYAGKSLESGAAYVVVDDPTICISADDRYLLVNDVLETLQLLANFHRRCLKIPVLAITGSNGKTTTKELCRDVLSKKFKTFATIGNYNNHIGVPLTLLSVTSDIEFLIVEMGANHQGEINELCKIAEPDYVMITNIGKAHLDGFGGLEGIKIGKSEMYRFAALHHSKIFINANDEVLMSLLPANADLVTYEASKMINLVSDEPTLTLEYKNEVLSTKLYGAYNMPNIAFAIFVGEYFGVAASDIISGISSYIPDNNRSQMTMLGTNRIIRDAYNANPSSMKLSLESFNKLKGKKVIVLGDMLELGTYAVHEHKLIIEFAENLDFQEMIFIGKNFLTAGLGKKGRYFEDVVEARDYFNTQQFTNTNILLKGSRGIAVEKILEN